MRAYIAGPLFNQGERWFDERIEAIAAGAGLETYLPHRDGFELLPDDPPIRTIFSLDVEQIETADIMIANLNGVTVDDGTAWEIGYAYARGKHLVGVYTDMRLAFPGEVVNLMIECSLHRLTRSLDELKAYLEEYVAAFAN